MFIWILTKLLPILGSKLSGYKTKIGGVGLILTGISTCGVAITMGVRLVFPDQTQFPEGTLDTMLTTFGLGTTSISFGFGALGIGHKIQKQIDATNAQTVAIVNSVQAHTQAVMESAPCNDNPSGVSDPNAGRQ